MPNDGSQGAARPTLEQKVPRGGTKGVKVALGGRVIGPQLDQGLRFERFGEVDDGLRAGATSRID